MRALCLIAVKPGHIDKVTQSILKKRKVTSEIMTVTGRADICVLVHGTLNEFDAVAIIEVKNLAQIKDVTTEIQKITGVERTETMVQVE